MPVRFRSRLSTRPDCNAPRASLSVRGGVVFCAIVIGSLSSPAIADEPSDVTEGAPEREARVEASFDEDSSADDEGEPARGPIRLGFEPEDLMRLGGSATVVGEDELEDHDFDNAETVIAGVPGVQSRSEDGYGLRPNIGLRGASSERSRKLTLMEDGILFGPAPYAAPAAYYFPLMTRMVGLEVFKGPATVLYGPNTIGGALNLLSRQVPEATSGAIDVGLGSGLYRKLHAWVGTSGSRAGFLAEVAMIGSDGFKEIDGHADRSTGINRAEALLTLQLTATTPRARHRFSLRGGYALERSNETYLGLSDSDFDADPYRRYAGSARDRMEWDRVEVRLRHAAEFAGASVVTTVYRHQLSRSWRKANGFEGAEFSDILADPTGGVREVFYDVLTGLADSSSRDENIVLGTNAREYVSQGAQTVVSIDRETETLEHQLEIGLRLHNDYIVRDHTELSYSMLDGELEGVEGTDAQTADNRGEAFALAGHTSYALNRDWFTVNPGARVEVVRAEFDNRLSGDSTSATRVAFLPGIGLHAALTPDWGVLAGVHRGFSAVAPGQAADVSPEYSVAYEAGARFGRVDEPTHAEAVGFFNDFSNMTSECSFSTGCSDTETGRQFNAGEVNVMGLEFAARHAIRLPNGWEMPVSGTYTLTKSSFRTEFVSDDPQLGAVEVGDELPYVPRHQGRVEWGLRGQNWSGSVAGTFVGESAEQAGTIGEEGLTTDRQALVDVFASYTPWRTLTLSFRAENVANAQSLASRRPFGARPVRPFRLTGGVQYSF